VIGKQILLRQVVMASGHRVFDIVNGFLNRCREVSSRWQGLWSRPVDGKSQINQIDYLAEIIPPRHL